LFFCFNPIDLNLVFSTLCCFLVFNGHLMKGHWATLSISCAWTFS
jgi:hypothetical protein